MGHKRREKHLRVLLIVSDSGGSVANAVDMKLVIDRVSVERII